MQKHQPGAGTQTSTLEIIRGLYISIVPLLVDAWGFVVILRFFDFSTIK